MQTNKTIFRQEFIASFLHFINIATLIRKEEWLNEIFDCLHDFRASITYFVIKLRHVNQSHWKFRFSIYLSDFVHVWFACHIVVCDVVFSFQSIFHFASCCFHREIQSRFSSFRLRSKMLFNRIIDDICQQIRFHSSHYVFMSECWLVRITFIRFTSQVECRLTHFDLSFRNFFMNNYEIATFALSKKKEKLFNLRSKLRILNFFFSSSWFFVLDLTKMFKLLIVYDQKSTRLNRAREFFFFSFFDYRSWRLNEINRFTIEIHQFTSSLINEREESKNSFFSFFVFFFSYKVSWKSKSVKIWMFNKESFILYLVSNVSCFEKNWDRSTSNTFYNWISDAFQISTLIYFWRLFLIMLHETHDI